MARIVWRKVPRDVRDDYLCRELIGRECLLLRTIELRGGKIIRRGTVARIFSTWRGRFNLKDGDGSVMMRRCERSDFDLVQRVSG
jgi:hypothetical protein